MNGHLRQERWWYGVDPGPSSQKFRLCAFISGVCGVFWFSEVVCAITAAFRVWSLKM